jgi:sugar diacid utilization regulator
MSGLQVDTPIPRVSGRLAVLTAELTRDPRLIIDRASRALVDGDETYAALAASVKHDVRDSVAFAAQLWLKAVIHGTPPGEDDLRTVADSGRRRVHQGVSLASLLHAVRLGSRELWQVLLEQCATDTAAREQLLGLFSPYLLDFFDSLAQRLASAYLDEQYQRARWRDALRHELLSIIFSFPDDAVAFRRTAESLGLDPATPRVALAMDVDLSLVVPSRMEGELDRLMLSVSRCLRLAASELVRTYHRDSLVVWIPTVRGDSVLVTDSLARDHARQLLDTTFDVKAIGIGMVNTGAAGWSTSANEALRALGWGRKLEGAGTVCAYSQFVLDESVLRSENALRYLDALIDRLSHEQELLLTLSVFFELGQHRKRVAERLGVHPNTLSYRLGRIEEILGARLDDASWQAMLHVALQLRRITDRPPSTSMP